MAAPHETTGTATSVPELVDAAAAENPDSSNSPATTARFKPTVNDVGYRQTRHVTESGLNEIA